MGPTGGRSFRERIASLFRPAPSRATSFFDAESRIRFDGEGYDGPDARTRLLTDDPVCGSRNCSHGTFSPRPESIHDQETDARLTDPFDFNQLSQVDESGRVQFVEGDGITSAPLDSSRNASTTKQLVQKHGLKHRRTM